MSKFYLIENKVLSFNLSLIHVNKYLPNTSYVAGLVLVTGVSG